MGGDAHVQVSTVLAALYLAGGPRQGATPRCAAQAVAYTLRAERPSIGGASSVLRSNGFWAEATLLESPGLLGWAEAQIVSGRALSLASPEYPVRWLTRLGPQSPPACWICGTMPQMPFIGAVGSRNVRKENARFARAIGAEIANLGYALVSGGAEGADRLAVLGSVSRGGSLVEILPHGLGRNFDSGRLGAARLSVCEPGAPFSTARAMERNSLIYALSEAVVVVQSRFRTGGTWHGVVDALRRKLTRLIVKEEPEELASRALVALGAVPLSEPFSLAEALRLPAGQAKLPFVRESLARYAA